MREDGTQIESFNTRPSPKLEEKCPFTSSRLWLQQDESKLKVRCESDALLRTKRDTYPVNVKKSKKAIVHVKYDKDQNNVEYDTDHEILRLSCRKEVDVKVRVARNETRFNEANLLLSDKPHPINIMHIVIEGASRANFMRQMRHLIMTIQDLEYDIHSQHRVFQMFRHSTINKSITKTTLSHPKRLVKLAKKYGHVTMYATTQCPRVRSASGKLVPLPNYKHTKQVDHSLSNLFCGTKKTCMAGRNHAQYVVDYTRDFMNKYGGVGRTSLIHFDRHEMNTVLDAILSSLVKDITSDHPHTSIIISGGGTGQTTGEDYYSSSMGHAESKLPLLIAIMPQHLTSKYPDAWKHFYHNQQIVTSPRDVVNTMKSMIKFSFSSGRQEGSLFEESFKKDRTCAQAGVSDRWCPCNHGAFYKSERTLQEQLSIAQQSAAKADERLSAFRDICQPIQFASLKSFGDTDHVITWNSQKGQSYETNIRTNQVRLLDTHQNQTPQVRNGASLLCDKSKIPIKDQELCTCINLK
ncbi:hypothetical protein AKO1_005506 [Acrasis kona]|uniref:Uncharacterized protein n=1 Tax=Acrasis kona TaxID=1008807 RepID=A0AAW2YJV4_9EUKA